MAYRKPKYSIGIQNVEVRPGATGAEKATAMADFAGKGSAIGSQIGSAFGPWGTAIGGAAGAIGGAVGGFFKGQQDALIADSMRRTDELDKKETMQQNMSYGGQENKQLKNAVIMQNNAGLIAEKGMKKTPHALVEVEGQELVYRKNNKGKYQLVQDHGGGPTHEQGGIDTWVKEGDVITPAKDRGVFMNLTNPATGEVIDDSQFEYFKNQLPEDNQEKPVKSMMECGTRSVKPRYFMGGIMGMMGGGGGGNMMNPIGNLISGGLGALADNKQQDANAMIQQNAMQNQALNQAQINSQQSMSGINQPALPMQRKGNRMVKPQYGIGGLVETDPETGQVIKQGAGAAPTSSTFTVSGTSEKPGEKGTEKLPDEVRPGAPGDFDPNAKPLPEGPENYPSRLGPNGIKYAKENPEWWATTFDQINKDPKAPITIPGGEREFQGPPTQEKWTKDFLTSTPGSAPSAANAFTAGGPQNQFDAPNVATGGKGGKGGNAEVNLVGDPFGLAAREQEATKQKAIDALSRPQQLPDMPPPQQFEYGKYQMPAGKLVAPNLNFDPASPTYQQYQDLSDPLRNQSNQAMNRDMANARELSGGSAANARANMAQASAGNFARQQQIDTQEMGRLSQVDAANRQSDNQFNMYNNQGANAVGQANAQNLANVQNQNMLNANQALNTNLNAMQTDRASARARDDYNKYTKDMQIERDRMAMERERQNKLIYGIQDDNPFSGHQTLGTQGPQDTDKGPVKKWFPNNGGSSTQPTPDPNNPSGTTPPALGGTPTPAYNGPLPSGSDPNALPNSNSQPVPDAPLPNTPDPPSTASTTNQQSDDAAYAESMKLAKARELEWAQKNAANGYALPINRKGNKYVKPRYGDATGGVTVDKDEDDETAETSTTPQPQTSGGVDANSWYKQHNAAKQARLDAENAADAAEDKADTDRLNSIMSNHATTQAAQLAYAGQQSTNYYDFLKSKNQLIDQTGGKGQPTTNSGNTQVPAGTSVGGAIPGILNSGMLPPGYSVDSKSSGGGGGPSASNSFSGAAPQNQFDAPNIAFGGGGGKGGNAEINGMPTGQGYGGGSYSQAPITPPPALNPNGGYTNTPGGPVGPLYGKAHRRARRDDGDDYRHKKWLEEQKEDRERIAAKTETKNAKTQGKYAYKSYKDDAKAQRRLNQTQNEYGQYVEEREQAQEDATDMDTYNQMMKQKGIVNRGENREQRGYNRAQGQERRQGSDIDRILHKTEMDNARAQRELQGIKNADAVARAYDNTVFANPDLPEAERFTVDEKYGLPKERMGNRSVNPQYGDGGQIEQALSSGGPASMVRRSEELAIPESIMRSAYGNYEWFPTTQNMNFPAFGTNMLKWEPQTEEYYAKTMQEDGGPAINPEYAAMKKRQETSVPTRPTKKYASPRYSEREKLGTKERGIDKVVSGLKELFKKKK